MVTIANPIANPIPKFNSPAISLPTTSLIQAPKTISLSQYRSSGWWCNLCKNYRLDSSHPHQLVVNHRDKTQFEIMVELIKNGNCEWIFFDCVLTKKQSSYLDNCLKTSNTQIVDVNTLHFSSRKIA